MLGAQKNLFIETVLLSTHNICFGCEIRKIIFSHTLLSGGLSYSLIQLELSENLTIALLQCFACSKRPEFLRILTSIKGHNLQKKTTNNPNVDFVTLNSYIKFGQNLSICSQDIERKQKNLA